MKETVDYAEKLVQAREAGSKRRWLILLVATAMSIWLVDRAIYFLDNGPVGPTHQEVQAEYSEIEFSAFTITLLLPLGLGIAVHLWHREVIKTKEIDEVLSATGEQPLVRHHLLDQHGAVGAVPWLWTVFLVPGGLHLLGLIVATDGWDWKSVLAGLTGMTGLLLAHPASCRASTPEPSGLK